MNWNQETANMIYVSNDGYAGHLAASLYSLLDNSRNIRSMDIYVLSVGMCRKYQKRLAAIAAAFNRKLYVEELGDLRDRFDFAVDTRGFDISAMGRLFAPLVLPETVKTALYLDCDTIVCRSIRPLYETDLGSCVAGMVMEPTVYEGMKKSIGLQRDDPYYNSGVLLMALDKWREQDVLGQLLDFYKSRQGRLFACDQDTLNGALKGRIRALPVSCNYFTNYRYFRYSTLCTLCAAYRRTGEEAYKEAARSPAVIHYMGDERPWIRGNHNHFKRLYEYYLGKTPWKNMEKERGQEGYMQLWWILNRLTLLSPGFRLWVSRRFGMRMVDSRKKHVKP